MNRDIDGILHIAQRLFTANPNTKMIAIRHNVNYTPTPLNEYTIVHNEFVPYTEIRSVDQLHGAYTRLIERIIDASFNQESARTPVDENVVNSLEEITVEQSSSMCNDKCAICLDNFIAGEKVILLDCGHYNHTACIKRWLTTRNTCPQCRSVIN